MKLNKLKTIFIFCLLLFLIFRVRLDSVFAEQISSSPESGGNSQIKILYDLLASTYSQGSDEAGDWGDWGEQWNRLRYNFKDYSQQSLVEYDDGRSGNGETEESIWTQTNTSPEVWKDEMTGLYWSSRQGSYTNVFPDDDHSTCDFFALSDRGSYDGSDADCGNAINYCGTLSLDDGGGAETDWYLPSQKELLQSYLNGVANQTTFANLAVYIFWSTTEKYNSVSSSYQVRLSNGSITASAKSNSGSTLCVRRD